MKLSYIQAAKLSADALNITVNDDLDVTFVKSGAKPEVTVVLTSGQELVQDSDYKVTYKNNKKLSTASKPASVVIKGIGNYKGTNVTKNFNIVAADPSQITLSVKDVLYNAKGKKGYALVTPKLLDDGAAVTVGKNKDVDAIAKDAYEYFNLTTEQALTKDHTAADVNPGDIIQVTVTIKCSGNSPYNTNGAAGTTATLTGYYKVLKDKSMDISKAKITVDPSKLVVSNGQPVILTEEDVKVTIGKTELKSTDFEIVSFTNNKSVGDAILTIKGKGNYGGTRSQKLKLTAKGIK